MTTALLNKTLLSALLKASAAAVAVLLPAMTLAGPNSDAPPNDPETERQAFKVAEGWEVTLFAAEPMVTKPIGINFDAQGRLWVAGSQTYPQVKPGDTPNDKIFVLEDTDGDGKADKSTVFAEGLFLATAVEIGDGGVYAANSTEVLHLKDTDGDGKADQKRVVLSGFGTEDTHHVIHGFRWDFGGRLNFLQGIYIGSRVETPRGTKVGLASTLWQLRPDKMDLGIYCQGLINPWGVTWDRYGQMFLTDGAGGEGVNFAPPGAQFTAAFGAQKVLKGLNPGSPKYCGAEILNGRLIPADWQGDLITNDFRANRTVRFKLSEDGSGFSAKLAGELIVSSDKAYRPVDVKMGPDGALYIADWYNPIINHGEVDFRDPRRDKVHGRIWRVAPKGSKPLAKPAIAGVAASALPPLLLSPEQWTRLQAKQALRAIGVKEAVPALEQWVHSWDAMRFAEGGLDHAQLEALWAYETLDVPEAKLLEKVLVSSNSNVRAAGVRVAGHWADRLKDARERVAAATADNHPRVRLEAVRALAQIGEETRDGTVVPQALVVIEKPTDPVIDFAIYQLLTDLKDLWLPQANIGKLQFAKPEHLALALRTVQSGDAVKKFVADLKAGSIAPEARKDAFELIASVGEPADLAVLLGQGSDPKLPPTVRAQALSALDRAARTRKVKPDRLSPAPLQKLLADASPLVQEQAARLIGAYKANGLKAEVEKMLIAPSSTASVRAAAAGALADLGDVAALKKSAEGSEPAGVRSAAIAGLASVDLKSAATLAGAFLTTAKPEDDPAPVLGAFLKREGGIDALSAALKGKTIPADTAKLSLRYVQGVGVEIGQLGEVIRTSAGASAGGAVNLSPADMKTLMEEVASKGDPALGQAVYRSKAASCQQCHMIGGVGGQLAPDLRAIGASSPVDYIVDSILNPAKAVKDGYSATAVTTKDGDLIQGIKVREDAKELILRDNTRDEIVVPIADIKTRKDAGSLMPAGLQDGLTRQELVHLVRFLSELGKPGTYSVPTTGVVRRWRVMDPVPADAAKPGEMFPADATWYPIYSLVNGDLPVGELPVTAGTSFVKFELQLAADGRIRLAFNSTKGITVWSGRTIVPTSGQSEVVVIEKKGVQEFTIRVDSAERGGLPLHVQVQEVADSKARPTAVGGR